MKGLCKTLSRNFACALLAGGFLLFFSSPVLGKWEKLDGCRLVTHGSNDGDSFRVELSDGRNFQFRLYFVDTPEVGLFYPDRVRDQASYFGVTQRQVLELGAEASRFTKSFLKGKTFTVWTEWKDAWGVQKRYAALVYCDQESLIECLVSRGFVRLKGFQPDSAWPGGLHAEAYRQLLVEFEQKARANRNGGWGMGSVGHLSDSGFSGKSKTDEHGHSSAISELPLLDLNAASREEIESLPGIGPVLSDRILKARPFSQLEDLVAVNGIGEVSLKKIQALVTVGFSSRPLKTAAYYLENPEEWVGREIELSIGKLELVSRDAPDGFVKMRAFTASEGQPGGALALYLQEEREVEALQYFERTERELLLRVRFFKYEGAWVTAYYKKTPGSTE